MSGRALIIVVTGIIITTSIILFNIGASGTKISQNLDNYFLRQTSQDIAQSGVNLAIRQLGNNASWRVGFSQLSMLGGNVSVRVFDTTYAGGSVICVRSTGTEEYNTSLQKYAVSTAYVFFKPATVPGFAKALATLNGPNQINGGIILDARDHDPFSSNVNANQGTWGVWSTSASFTQSGGATIGGTTAIPLDVPPLAAPLDTVVIRTNQTYPGGYPTSPDSALGGANNGFTEGTIKAVAKSGIGGSQYVTDPTQLKYPLKGVTYVDLPSASNIWKPTLSGSGILIVHNSAHNADIENAGGTFSGILISDDITHFHGNFWGAVMCLSPFPQGNVFGNGSATIYFSRLAVKNAMSIITNGAQLKVLAWYE